MAHQRQHKDFAKKLARLSLDAGGQIDASRVNAVIESLRSHPPRAQRGILKAYLHYLQIEDRRGRVVVEYSGETPPSGLESLRARLEGKYGRTLIMEARENSALIAGMRASVADDIYESSVSGRLAALSSALS